MSIRPFGSVPPAVNRGSAGNRDQVINVKATSVAQARTAAKRLPDPAAGYVWEHNFNVKEGTVSFFQRQLLPNEAGGRERGAKATIEEAWAPPPLASTGWKPR